MQVSVEKVSNVLRRLTIVVPQNLVEEAYNKHIDRFAQNAKLDGFRPGKAPKNYITQRYGNDARQEAISEVVQKAVYDAIVAEKLNPITTPKIEPKVTLPDQPLEFIASFEVLPEIDTIHCDLKTVEKPIVTVTDQDVDHVVGQLQKQHTKWKEVNRAAKDKDRVVINYYAIMDGQADDANAIKNFPLELGSNTMLPGFEAGLIGAKEGEQRKLQLTFPADFQIPERAGQPVEFVVDVVKVYEADVPSVDDAFVKQLGIKTGDVSELKDQIKQSLTQEGDRLTSEKLKEQVFKQLLDQNQIEVPESLVTREAHSIHDEIYQHQQHDHHSHSDEEMTAFNDIAKKRVTLGLLIAEYAKKANLQIDKDRVQKRIQEIAAAYENPAEVIAWLSAPERRGGLEGQVMEDQVMEKLLSTTTVTEKPMTYAELKGIKL